MKISLALISIYAVTAFADDSTLIAELTQKARAGDTEAQYQLGYMFSRAEGVERDILRAHNWLRNAAEKGHARAQYELGSLYDVSGGLEYPPLIDLRLKKIIDSLEKKYYVSESTRKMIAEKLFDEMDAVTWYLKAANQGLADAQHALGNLYFYGLQNMHEDSAILWYEKAARQDFMYAQSMLGFIYCGRGKSVDAYFWLKLALDKGDENILGMFERLNKEITQEELQEAQKLLDKWYTRKEK